MEFEAWWVFKGTWILNSVRMNVHFTKEKLKEKIMIVGVYADDLILTGENQNVIKKFKLEIQQKFDMTNLRLLIFISILRLNKLQPQFLFVKQIMPRRFWIKWE